MAENAKRKAERADRRAFRQQLQVNQQLADEPDSPLAEILESARRRPGTRNAVHTDSNTHSIALRVRT